MNNYLWKYGSIEKQAQGPAPAAAAAQPPASPATGAATPASPNATKKPADYKSIKDSFMQWLQKFSNEAQTYGPAETMFKYVSLLRGLTGRNAVQQQIPVQGSSNRNSILGNPNYRYGGFNRNYNINNNIAPLISGQPQAHFSAMLSDAYGGNRAMDQIKQSARKYRLGQDSNQ